MKQLNNEKVICFEWHFISKPEILHYRICETIQECCKLIETQYRCKESDYIITAKQERLFTENKSEIIREEAYD